MKRSPRRARARTYCAEGKAITGNGELKATSGALRLPPNAPYLLYPLQSGKAWARAADWPYSTIHRYIAAGTVTQDWGAGEPSEDVQFGER